MSTRSLPKKGMPRENLMNELRRLHSKDADYEHGRTWSLVYQADETLMDLAKEAYTMFMSENGLNPMVFPSLRMFETEVVAMVADMLHGGVDAQGSMTSGGTESILLAIKTARDKFRAERPEIKEPEMILPVSAHPAHVKGAHYFDVKPVYIPITPDFRADDEAARGAVTGNTILIVGSAPCYSQAVVDPIPALAAIALENNICCHVDSCFGGFQLPFLEKLGYPVPPFDFRVPGVTSISADVHKWGYGAKGASVILYRDESLRGYQFFAHTDYPGGVFASPTILGTRPGGAIAAAWAVMNFLGEEGYMRLVKISMETAEKLKEGILGIPGFKILGKPDIAAFGFDSDLVNIYAVGEELERRAWFIDRLQMPPGLHLTVTPMHARVVDEFLDDMRASVRMQEGKKKEDVAGMAAIYGMLGTLPDRKAAKDMVLAYLNDMMKCQ